ncbi:MAG: hypothetical protein ABI461_04900, partial [Polyangiaceae bacterium]
MSPASFSSRKFIALAILVSPLVVLACSQASSHPAQVGDCSGANCPPGQGQGSTSGSSGSSDASTATDGSSTGRDGGANT